MNEDFYIVAIAALLPLTAGMLVLQVNPYHALVIRGILGAVAALVYVLFGAADVALTEALVGTMLSITLYAVAVRSSLNMRIGVLSDEASNQSPNGHSISPETTASPSEPLLSALRKALSKYHMRLELVAYNNPRDLQTALIAKEIHTTYVLSKPGDDSASSSLSGADAQSPYHIQTRVQRLYDVMQAELPPTLANLTYVNSASASLTDVNQTGLGSPVLMEDQP